jgi:3D (Asp-Asp-Asp) domain-containing protein
MTILTNAKYVSPKARRVMAFLALAVTITSTNVQSARASALLPEAPTWATDQVDSDDADRKLVVPVVKPVATKSLASAPAKAKKKWNTVNAPDLTTPVEYSDEPAVRTIRVPISAYNSEPGQTDSSPFTTADGSQVRDGIVAANFLPHGTRIRIPDQFGNKVFEVHDRMNARYTYKIDIWMLNKSDAFKWGVRNVKVEILN